MSLPVEQQAGLNLTDPGALPIRLPPIDGTSGALLIGTFIGLFLLGLILHQAERYARTFPGDSLWIKSLVALMVFLEIASSGINVHVCYHSLVTNYFHPERAVNNTWTISLTPLTTEVTLFLTQGWFARRLWILGPRYRPVVIVACICILAELGVIMAPTINLLGSTYSQASEEVPYVYLIPTSFALALAVNVMLTIPLIYTLQVHRKRAGFSRSTNAMLDILILYSVSTGLLNGVFDLITLILAFTFLRDYLYTIPALPAGKLYGITLLAALHSRRTVRDRGQSRHDDVSEMVFGVSVLPQAAPPSADTRLPSQRERIHAHRLPPMPMGSENSDVIELKALSLSTPYGGTAHKMDMTGNAGNHGDSGTIYQASNMHLRIASVMKNQMSAPIVWEKKQDLGKGHTLSKLYAFVDAKRTLMPAIFIQRGSLLSERDVSSTPLSSITFPINDTLGYLLIGSYIGFAFYGLTLYQAYHYARTYPGDSLTLKVLVGLTVFLETAASGLLAHTCYSFLVTDYASPERVLIGVWSVNLYSTIASLGMVAAQSFFCARLWLLGRQYRLAVILSCAFSLTELGFFTAVTAKMFTAHLGDDEHALTVQRALGYTLALVADVILTTVLIYVLHRSRTGFKGTDNMIDRLILYSVSTGLLTGVFDLLTVIFAFVRPESYIYSIFGIPGSRLYAITLLAALNSRGTFRARDAAGTELPGSVAVFGVVSQSPHTLTTDTAWSSSDGLRAHRLRPMSLDDSSEIIELSLARNNIAAAAADYDEKIPEVF
ncbi:hypothetical protein VTO73DRAFT_9832 [Trametes versicolor]